MQASFFLINFFSLPIKKKKKKKIGFVEVPFEPGFTGMCKIEFVEEPFILKYLRGNIMIRDIINSKF